MSFYLPWWARAILFPIVIIDRIFRIKEKELPKEEPKKSDEENPKNRI